MRNLLALVGLVVVAVGGGGWYLGWYKVDVKKAPDGNLQINTQVDTKKASADSTEIIKNIGAVISDQVQKSAQEGKAAPPQTTPVSTPGPLAPGSNAQPTPGEVLAPLPPIAPPPTPVPPRDPIRLIPPK